jgi:hypothetical protein
MADGRHLCFRINAFYAVNACVSNVFYAVFACVSSVYVSSAFDDHQNCDWHSYRFEEAPEFYRIKEFHFLPMSPSLLERKIVISGPIKKLKHTNANV